MRKVKKSYGKICLQTAAIGLCTCVTVMSPYQRMTGIASETAGFREMAEGPAVETGSNASAVTGSDAMKLFAARSLSTGDLWENWIGDLSFLSGETGTGTEEHPYQISTADHLKGLSELVSRGMVIEDGEGTYPGDYTGAYFKLMRNIDLEGIEWMPIGFYQNESEMMTGEYRPFQGYFDGNGKTISNFKIYQNDWKNAGLFGVMEEAVVHDLKVRPGYVITAEEQVGILAGRTINSVIRNVTVSGAVQSNGTAGGLAGSVEDGTVVENCTADHVIVDTGTEKEVYAGGIAGTASESLIADCSVNTGDSLTARIRGDGYVGGVVGFQNQTDIFNVHVTGTVGGNGSRAIGGITGKYASGKMKVARFEGIVADSGMGSLAREGTFIGTHDTGFTFKYGTGEDEDLAYLFADSESKITAGICGSGISDDNCFDYDDHIGFWHGKDNFYTLVQGQNTKTETERYFYEELEAGILTCIDSEYYARDGVYQPDHFAPNAAGRPARGYLVSILQIDTAANVEDYYDVATLTARGESAYSKELDKTTRGAVAAGDIVTVMTAPKNTDMDKYQMDGVPTYTDERGNRVDMSYMTGGSYSFIMPAHDTELTAEYQKVAADIRVSPEEVVYKVVQERSGDRKNPSIITEVRDQRGRLLARYLNGSLEEGTTVQSTKVEAVINTNNDVEDNRVYWSVDDSNLILLEKNEDEDSSGYTAMSASIRLNPEADFFQDIIEQAEQEQAEKGYRYAIPDTVYGNGTRGGIAVLTAKTRAASSFEGKSAEANCRIPVTFRIKDRTTVGVEQITLDHQELEFVVTRKLTGYRKQPKEEWTVSIPQTLSVVSEPEYFDKKQVYWKTEDLQLIRLDSSDYTSAESGTAYRSATVSALQDAEWIRALMEQDDQKYASDWKYCRTAEGTREAEVRITAEDVQGNYEEDVCKVTIRFVTQDETVLSGRRSSGGSSSGSSAGGASSASAKGESSGNTETGDTGTWIRLPDGTWMYQKGNQVYADTWEYIYNPYAAEGQPLYSWFRFDGNGIMLTGWYPAEDGNRYYLHEQEDGSQGHMVTGWRQIRGNWYYFGADGAMYRDAETPDGFTVDADGRWTVDGVVQTGKDNV